MNALFGIFIAISIFLTLFVSPSLLLSAIGTAGARAFTLSATLAGIYAFWMGIIKILEKTPALSKLERMVYPIVSRIFPTETSETRKLITMNITANMLGVGGASTPLAISAIQKMKENATGKNVGDLENGGNVGNGGKLKSSDSLKNGKTKDTAKISRATKSMLMLFILNATSLQILPTTIISLRTSAGSVSPASILIPTTIASVLATVFGGLLIWAFEK